MYMSLLAGRPAVPSPRGLGAATASTSLRVAAQRFVDATQAARQLLCQQPVAAVDLQAAKHFILGAFGAQPPREGRLGRRTYAAAAWFTVSECS